MIVIVRPYSRGFQIKRQLLYSEFITIFFFDLSFDFDTALADSDSDSDSDSYDI
jgi:hypothetical protein